MVTKHSILTLRLDRDKWGKKSESRNKHIYPLPVGLVRVSSLLKEERRVCSTYCGRIRRSPSIKE